MTLIEPRHVRLPFGIDYRGGSRRRRSATWGGWDERPRLALGNTIAGGGTGLRLLLPVVSLLRFDVGWGQAGFNARLHIGAQEKSEMARKRVR